MIPTISPLLLLSILSLVGFVHGVDLTLVLYKAYHFNDNGENGDPIQVIADGNDFDLQVVGDALTMVAEFDSTGYRFPNVKFEFETSSFKDIDRPFTIAGDKIKYGNYIRSDYLSEVGEKKVTVTAYGAKGRKAEDIIATKTITFKISNSGIKETLKLESLFLVQANKPKAESMLALLSDGMKVDLVKIFDDPDRENDKELINFFPLPLALYVRFKGGPIKPKSVTFNFYTNTTNSFTGIDGVDGTLGISNSGIDRYAPLHDLMEPGYKTVTINAYDDTSSPLIFTKTYHFTIITHKDYVNDGAAGTNE